MRVGAGEVRPGDVLPESVSTMPYERTVYLTLGTVFNSTEEFAVPLEALRELPVNVVLTCGYGADPAAFAPLPRNVVVEQYISQALLLPRCSAVVCHAGAGTVIGALGPRRAGGLPAARRGPVHQRRAGEAYGRGYHLAARSGLRGVDPRRHPPSDR